MADLFWLSSYPKSGNTWMRILLANYRARAAVDINRLPHYGLGGAYLRNSFDQYCSFKSSTLPVHIVERLRPEIYRVLATAAPQTLILKVHDSWRVNDRGEPLFPSNVTGGVIYVLRNVLDVAPSVADHWGIDCAGAVARLCDPAFALAADPRHLDPGMRQFLGTWSNHAESWVDRSPLRILVVRYEDLIADTAGSLEKVLGFLNWEVEPDAIAAAVENASFSRLQTVERETGFREVSAKAHTSFFRRGKVGSWREELAPDLVRKLIDVNGDAMRRFGYLDEQGNPVS